ncbi:MAG: HEAT repeat domain-containing protein [Chloroflexota bacterium]
MHVLLVLACLATVSAFLLTPTWVQSYARTPGEPTATKTPKKAFTPPVTSDTVCTPAPEFPADAPAYVKATPRCFPPAAPVSGGTLGLDTELIDLLTACFFGGLFVYFVIFTLLAFAGWRARGKKTQELVYVPLAPLINPSASLIGLLLKLAYPAFLLALIVIVILAGILGGVLQLLGKAIRAGVRSWIKRGTRVFDFAHSALQSIFDLNRQALRLIETLVTIVLTHHLIARQLAVDSTLNWLSQLNLSHLLLEIFSSLACDVKQPQAHRLEAIQWIGKMVQFIPAGHYLALRNTGDRLLEIAQDTSLPIKLRIAAARILSSYTYANNHKKAHRKAQYFKREYVIRAWQALAKDTCIPTPLIRISAIRTLYGQFHGHREAYAILDRILENTTAKNHQQATDELLVRAAWFLGQISSPQELNLMADQQKAIEYLRYYSRCSDCAAYIRYLASSALGALGERDEAGVLLHHLAYEGEPNIRQRAVAALYRLRQQKWLVALANQKSWQAGHDLTVRLRAVEFLRHLDRNVSACLWLEIASQTALQPGERIQAACHALQDGEPGARLLLQQIGEGSGYTGAHRLLAAEALARCNYIEDARLIYMLLSHDMLADRAVATQAIRALTRLRR